MKEKSASILCKLRQEIENKQASMIEDIRKKERDLLTNVKTNPRKWNRHHLQITINTCELETTVPYVQVEFITPDKSKASNIASDTAWTQQRFDGPYSPSGEETIGKIDWVYPNYELSFDMKIDELAISKYDFLQVLRISSWFYFKVRCSNESKYVLYLRVV